MSNALQFEQLPHFPLHLLFAFMLCLQAPRLYAGQEFYEAWDQVLAKNVKFGPFTKAVKVPIKVNKMDLALVAEELLCLRANERTSTCAKLLEEVDRWGFRPAGPMYSSMQDAYDEYSTPATSIGDWTLWVGRYWIPKKKPWLAYDVPTRGEAELENLAGGWVRIKSRSWVTNGRQYGRGSVQVNEVNFEKRIQRAAIYSLDGDFVDLDGDGVDEIVNYTELEGEGYFYWWEALRWDGKNWLPCNDLLLGPESPWLVRELAWEKYVGRKKAGSSAAKNTKNEAFSRQQQWMAYIAQRTGADFSKVNPEKVEREFQAILKSR